MSASNPGEEWGTAAQAATDALDAVLDMGATPETADTSTSSAPPFVSQPDLRPRKRRRRHAAGGSDHQAAAAATTTRHLLGTTQRQVMLLSQHVAYLHGMASVRVAACSQGPEWGLRATAEDDAMGTAGLDRFLTGGHFAVHPVRSTVRALCDRKKRPRAHRKWRFGAAPLVFTGVPA